MEQFQVAWITALTAAAGCIMWEPRIDDGIDVMLEHKHETHLKHDAMVSLQLKATTRAPSNGAVSVQMSRKRLREYSEPDPLIPKIVAILKMPAEQAHWTYTTDRSLSLFSGCYWVNLAGLTVPVGREDSKVTICAPVKNRLDDVSLVQIMERVGRGERP